ncbi:MAG: preprotein translocase subunit SecG [Deltaproteobacteria bacterium]|jgi:preprotein translocase subunit SecG|nr:preprotein translocase subunit SecG [Deltaproteobacteria bacterium]
MAQMSAAITSIHVMVAVILMVSVLLQTGKGSGLGAAFGGSSSSVFGSRGPATIISRVTSVAALIFMTTSLILSIFAHGLTTSGSVVTADETVKEEKAVDSLEGKKVSEEEVQNLSLNPETISLENILEQAISPNPTNDANNNAATSPTADGPKSNEAALPSPQDAQTGPNPVQAAPSTPTSSPDKSVPSNSASSNPSDTSLNDPAASHSDHNLTPSSISDGASVSSTPNSALETSSQSSGQNPEATSEVIAPDKEAIAATSDASSPQKSRAAGNERQRRTQRSGNR